MACFLSEKIEMGKGKASKWITSCAAAATMCFFLSLLHAGIPWSSPSDFSAISSWWTRASGGSHGLSGRSTETRVDPSEFAFQRLVKGRKRRELDATGISCFSDALSDVCIAKQNVRIDTRTMTVYIASSNHLPPKRHVIRPYARRTDPVCMESVTKVELVTGAENLRPPACQVTHPVPAIVFSTGGFSTNLFHDFNDIIIPLFLTSHRFHSQLTFVIVDFKPSWVRKYSQILSHMSAYPPIDTSQDGRVHCFTGAVVGLKYHSDLTCNASDIPGGYSTLDFKRFLRSSFNLKDRNGAAAASTGRQESKKPKLILISRTNSRKFLNEEELVRMAKELGFHVSRASPQRVANIDKFAEAVHSCDVLVGAHGAGITNSLFLSEGAVLVQVVPLGLDWPSTTFFGEPSRRMGIHYLEYRIGYNESSLSDMYPPEHPVIVDPKSVHLQGYYMARAIYVDSQNIRLDMSRFKGILLQAMHLLGDLPLSNNE